MGTTMDTMLYDFSIPLINSLQHKLAGQEDFMQLMSMVFDPKYAFLIYSPLAYLLDPKVGKKLIMTTVIAEWFNQILKWFLHGERPYWYVHSSGHFDPEQTPIKQFPSTCELGPGHPSGHAMLTAAVWYVILSSIHQAYHNHHQSGSVVESTNLSAPKDDQQLTSGASSSSSSSSLIGGGDTLAPAVISKQTTTLFAWTLYLSLILVVSVSRVFLGCHFPHQCLIGAALGLLTAKWISSKHIRAIHYIWASIFLFSTALGTFGLLQASGFEPNWTIELATKHCIKREYIHLDTAPFFSIMRYCGFALGCGLGLLFPIRSYAKQLVPVGGQTLVDCDVKVDTKSPFSTRNLSWLSFKFVMALLMARLVDNLALFVSHSNLNWFYSCAFAAYTLFSYAFINL